jgi:hypothetical protein
MVPYQRKGSFCGGELDPLWKWAFTLLTTWFIYVRGNENIRCYINFVHIDVQKVISPFKKDLTKQAYPACVSAM